MPGFVGHGDMHGTCISVREDGDGPDAEPFGSLDNPACDFATVGNEDFLEHEQSPHIRNRPKVVSSIGALSVAESDRPRMSRVLRGSTMPSSHSRAEA